MSNSLWPHESQHTRLPCPSSSPRDCWNSCPLSPLVIPSLAVCFSTCLQSFPASGSFLMTQLSTSCGQSISFDFSISHSNEYSGLIFFRIDRLDPWCPKDSQESSPTSQLKSISSSMLSLLFGRTLTSTHEYWKNHRFDYTDLCQQSNVFALKYAV